MTKNEVNGSSANKGSGLRSSKRSKADYAAEDRARREFLKALGISNPWAVATYARNCLLKPRIADPWATEVLEDQLARHDDDVTKRIRSFPRYAHAYRRSRKAVGTRVKASSAVFKSILEDAQQADDAVIVQETVVAQIWQRLIEEEALLRALEQHRQAALRLEDKALRAAPKPSAIARRIFEQAGLDELLEADEAEEFADAYAELIDRFSHRKEDDCGVRRRMVARLATSIEDYERGSNDDVELSHAASDWAPRASETSGSECLRQDVRFDVSEMQSSPIDGPADEPDDDVSDHDERARHPSYVRAEGHGRIDGLTPENCFAGVVSAVQHGPESTLLDAASACMQTRSAIDLGELVVMPGGMVEAAAWTRFEVPMGPYVLQQTLGCSNTLPPFHSAVSLPPYISLAQYGRLLGLADFELRDLALWDAPGDGPAHMRPHLLNGPAGRPDLAYEVMKRAVEDHYRLNEGLNRLPELTAKAADQMARFWLFLVAGRMRPASISTLWGEGFFAGVEGHDPVLKDTGYWSLRAAE